MGHTGRLNFAMEIHYRSSSFAEYANRVIFEQMRFVEEWVCCVSPEGSLTHYNCKPNSRLAPDLAISSFRMGKGRTTMSLLQIVSINC